MGIRHVVLAVNKADLIGFDQARFTEICAEYEAAVASFGFATLLAIPLAARFGDNVVSRSARTPWYTGPTLLQHLETVALEQATEGPFRMPVQWVNRPKLHLPAAMPARSRAGRLRPGDAGDGRRVGPADDGRTHRHRRWRLGGGHHAVDAVTLVLADELDVSRGEGAGGRGQSRRLGRPVPGTSNLAGGGCPW